MPKVKPADLATYWTALQARALGSLSGASPEEVRLMSHVFYAGAAASMDLLLSAYLMGADDFARCADGVRKELRLVVDQLPSDA